MSQFLLQLPTVVLLNETVRINFLAEFVGRFGPFTVTDALRKRWCILPSHPQDPIGYRSAQDNGCQSAGGRGSGYY